MATPEENPTRNLGLLPTFTQPPTPLPGPQMTQDSPEDPSPTPPPPEPPRRLLSGLGTPRLGPGDTLTETSSTGDKPTAVQTTALAVGVLAVVVAGFAFVVRRRMGRKLREPTKQQSTDIASPLGRILLRHADLAWLSPDIADGLKAAAATGAYLNDGPLIEYDGVDAGVPPNLQEDPY